MYHSGAYSKNIPAAWLHSVFPSGVIGGGQIGYNYQFNPNIVFGIEADFQGSDMNTADAYFGFGLSQNFVKSNKSIDWFGTTRGRIGLTIPGYSNVLLYGTGGFAYGQVYNNVSSAHLWSGGATCGGATGTSTYNQTSQPFFNRVCHVKSFFYVFAGVMVLSAVA